MALIKLGGVVSEIRGSIGGTTYARNRYGAYARNRTKPVDPGTNTQTEFRTRVSSGVAAWQALTATQRDAFNAKAQTTGLVNRLGEDFHPSGMNLFMRTYNLLDIASLTQVTAPPVTPIIDDSGAYIDHDIATGLDIHSDVSEWPADAVMVIWYTFNKTNSTYFYKGPYDHFHDLLAGEFVADIVTLQTTAAIDADSSMFAVWRLVGDDGAASHARRMRAYKPPA